MQIEAIKNSEIRPLKAEKFIESALGHMSSYKEKHIYRVFARDFLEKTDNVNTGYGRWLNNIIAYLIKEYSLKDNPRILDFGCGTGELTNRMASLGFQTSGLDTEMHNLKVAKLLARENNLSNIDFILGGGTRLPFADGSFDIITMFSVFEHLSDETLRWFIPELKRVCRGVVYIVVPNRLKAIDDHTGLYLVPWLPGWIVAPYVKIMGRTHPSSMLDSGKWGVYYRSFRYITGLFKKNGFDLGLPGDCLIYPSLDLTPAISGIGKHFKIGAKKYFIGIPFPKTIKEKLGYPKQAFYQYLNLILVPHKNKNLSDRQLPLGDRGNLGERVDVDSDPDLRSRCEHLWRYKFAAKRARGRILDLGCGIGYGSKLLRDAGNEVDAVDISAQAVSYAREKYPGPRYFLSNVESLPFPDNHFDAISAFEVIEHLADPYAGLSEIRRVLRKRGELFISTPNPRHFWSILKHFIFMKPYPEMVDRGNIYHVKEFHYSEFIKLLRGYNFRIKAIYGQTIPCIPTFYRLNFDLGKIFPRLAWTIVVHAVKGE